MELLMERERYTFCGQNARAKVSATSNDFHATETESKEEDGKNEKYIIFIERRHRSVYTYRF